VCSLDGAFEQYFVTLCLAVYAGGSFGMLIGVICDTTDQAAQMVPAAIIPVLMFADCIVGLNSLPEAAAKLYRIDPMYWLVRAMMVIEFTGAVYPYEILEEMEGICEDYNENNVNGSWVVPTEQEAIDIILEENNCSTISTSGEIPSIGVINNTASSGDDASLWFEAFGSTEMPMNETSTTGFSTTTPYSNLDLSNYCKDNETAADSFSGAYVPFEWVPREMRDCWGIIAIHCAVLRVLSMFLLIFMNNDGFSRVSAFLKKVARCQCKEEEVEFDDDAAVAPDTKEVKAMTPTMNEESTKL